MFVSLYQITWAWKDAYIFFYLVVIWCYVYSFQFKSQTFCTSCWCLSGALEVKILSTSLAASYFTSVFSYLQKAKIFFFLILLHCILCVLIPHRSTQLKYIDLISFHLLVCRDYMSKIQKFYTFTVNSENKGSFTPGVSVNTVTTLRWH